MATRRSLAGGVVATLLGTAGAHAALQSPTLGHAHPDSTLIALCAEFCAVEASYCALYDDPDLDDTHTEDARMALAAPMFEAWDRMLDRMATLRATTHEGLAARAVALAQHSGIKPGTACYPFAFDPDDETVTGRLLHYLLRDTLAVGDESPLQGARS